MMAVIKGVLASFQLWQWLLLAFAMVLLVLLVWLLLRARKNRRLRKLPDEKPPLPKRWLQSVTDALRYITTRQAWRYQHQWVLLLGELGAGKSSLAASIEATDREANLLQSHQQKPRQWQHLKGLNTIADGVVLNRDGIIIDPPGELANAASDSKQAQQWQQLLDAINTERPERPLDAVVLTLSAVSLQHKTPEQLTALADNLYLQLWQLQKRFEFVLPLYVVISHCDSLEGYDAYWQQLDPARRQEMWGWSNDALNDQETVPVLVASVFEEVMTSLRQHQIQAAARHENIDNADDFFLFPRRVLGLAEPLIKVLEQLFRPSTFMVNNYLRGIYFTGSLQAKQNPQQGATHQVDFVRQLFTDKIFKEKRLARPLRQSIWSRNRVIRNLQYGLIAATLVSAGVLGYQSLNLDKQVSHMNNTLETVNLVNHLQVTNAGCINQSDIFRVIDSIGDVPASFHSVVIPISYVDSRMLEKASAWLANKSLSNIVMTGMHCELVKKIKELKARPSHINDPLMTSTSLTNDRTLLLNYLDQVNALEDAVEGFNYISKTASNGDTGRQVKAFEDLLHYLYGRAVPESVRQSNSIYSSAVTKVSYAKPLLLDKPYKDMISSNLAIMASHYHQQLLDRVDFGTDLIAKLQNQQGDIPDEIVALKDWINWMRTSWLGNDAKHNPCADMARDLDDKLRPLYRDHGYEVSLEKQVDQFASDQCYDKVMAQLGAFKLAPYGNVFSPTLSGGYTLNPKLLPEMGGVSALAELPLMHVPASQGFSCQAATESWNIEQLAQAERFIEQYQTFAQSQKADTSQPLPLYLQLARQHLSGLLAATLADAQQLPAPQDSNNIGVESQLASAAANFTKAQDKLSKLRQQMASIGDAKGASELNSCVQGYSTNMLRKLSLLTENSRLYSPQATAANADPQTKIYRLGSSSDVKDYLARQRQRVMVLASYAQPFIQYLSQNPATISTTALPANATAAYWQGTSAQLKAYQDAVPDADVASLDDFIGKTLAPMDYQNCGQLLQSQAALPDGNNLFAQQGQQLATQTQWRCDDRRDADAYSQYRELATRFNSQLAGRYPFAGTDAPDADPATVKAFFTDYLAEKASLAAAIAGLPESHWQTIRAFLAKLDAAAAFFGPVLTGNQSLALAVSVDFNALPKNSSGSDQLIAWQLATPANSARFPGGPQQLPWALGQSLTLTLSWANQSPWQPRIDPAQAQLTTTGQSARFTQTGNWALLKLIETHKPLAVSATDPLNASRYYLAFKVPVIDGNNPPNNASALLYMALGLGVTDSKTQVKQPLVLPKDWPVSAPVYW
ncbi:type VI secretion system protein [Gallaecimonas mangrovi]|uniref:type VI secretion system protein n=1 Tax=Gallaecimonas mangrovi TaxID=2291597 RepID=UPI000E1FD40B|nr:type VI secretion system protein [Gallaecimonas mangrovi]